MSQFFLRTNTIFLIIWIALMLYGFYKYYKNIDFKNISLGNFICANLIFFLCGYITVAMIFGIEHLLLLPFMPFGIAMLTRWYGINPRFIVISTIAAFSFFLLFYNLLITKLRNDIRIISVLITLFWMVLFLSGGASFLYALAKFTFN